MAIANWLLKNVSTLYLFGYFGLIVLISLLECIIPRRPAGDFMKKRWLGNIGVTVVDTIIIRSLFPTLSVGLAMLAADRHWGLFHRLHLPSWADVILTLIIFDFIGYLQHYTFHRVPLLWRVHRTHHTDHDFDFSTGLRFHPLEGIITTAVDLAAVAALGPTPVAVLVSQLMTMAQTLWEHGNFRIPHRWDHAIRLLIVTPDMHRIHHSLDVHESQSNLANTFTWWDRLFKTYMENPKLVAERMTFGVVDFESSKHLTLLWILAQPFLRDSAAGARNDVVSASRIAN